MKESHKLPVQGDVINLLQYKVELSFSSNRNVSCRCWYLSFLDKVQHRFNLCHMNCEQKKIFCNAIHATQLCWGHMEECVVLDPNKMLVTQCYLLSTDPLSIRHYYYLSLTHYLILWFLTNSTKLVKKFLILHGIQRFISKFTTAQQCAAF